MQVDEGGVLGRAAGGLVQALAIQAERGGRRGKPLGRGEQVFFAQTANLGHFVGCVVAHQGFQGVKALGVGGHVSRVQPAFPQHGVQQAVEQCHVSAGLQGQIQVRQAGGVGAARVRHDDLHARVGGLGVFNAPEQNRVRPGRVGADDEQRVRVVHVVIAGRGRVSAQREFVASHRAAHAQAGVGVDVVGAQQPLGQLVEDVIVFGEQLPADVKPHGVGAMRLHDAGQFLAGKVECAVPAHGRGRALAFQTAHRLQQPRLAGDLGAGGQGQRAAFAAQAAQVGRVLGVTAHPGDLAAFGLDDHTAAHAAVGTGGFGLGHGAVSLGQVGMGRGVRRRL